MRALRSTVVADGVAGAVLALGACTPAKQSAPPVHGSVLFDTVGTHSFTVPPGTYQLAIDAYGAAGGGGGGGLGYGPSNTTSETGVRGGNGRIVLTY